MLSYTARYLLGSLVFLTCLVTLSCKKMFPGEPEAETRLNQPLDGLTAEQLQAHAQGDEQFGRIFTAENGLGPMFVAQSCESCHVGDGKGHPLVTITRFGRYDGVWNALIDKGGPQLQNRCINGYQAESVPSEANGMTKLLAPIVAGLGFLAAVPDSVILALADPNDLDGDGISGRPNYLTPPSYFVPQAFHKPDAQGRYIGRFGKKAGAIDLTQQTANAYLQDMGITSDFNPNDLYNYQVGVTSGDNVTDPEITANTVHNVVFYMRTLKAPPRRNTTDPNVVRGQQLFLEIGCAKCHTPTLTTGISDINALSQKTFAAYTDLLLHDMGQELNDNYTEGDAQLSEWKTAPLWGIGLAANSQGGTGYFLHDGRATTLQQAIEYHGGEGANSRQRFRNLSQTEKDQLIEFLKSL